MPHAKHPFPDGERARQQRHRLFGTRLVDQGTREHREIGGGLGVLGAVPGFDDCQGLAIPALGVAVLAGLGRLQAPGLGTVEPVDFDSMTPAEVWRFASLGIEE